jgi:hypothetical protein
MDLNLYKKNRIDELRKKYVKDIDSLNQQYRTIVTSIQRKKIRAQLKQPQYNEAKNIYAMHVSTLQSQLQKNIDIVQSFVPTPPIITNKTALLIGINYIGTSSELNGCINDVTSVKERLTQQGFSIKTLTDTDKPTRETILTEFTNLLKNASAGDLLFFLYSGHGSYVVDKNGDEKDRYDEVLVSSDFKAVLDDELKTLITQYLKKDVTLFGLFDSCFSGTILDLKYQFLDSENYDKYTENSSNIETMGNVYMISGCTEHQTSADAYIGNKFQGAMTWSLLESLKLPQTSWRTLIKTMRKLLKDSKYTQLPQFATGNFVNIDSNVFI